MSKTGCLFSLLFGLAAVLGIYWAFASPLAIHGPGEERLLELFRAHRVEFDALREMSIRDSPILDPITKRSLLETGKLSASRREAYMSLTKFAPDMEVGTSEFGVYFKLAAGGRGLMIAKEWMEGIAYLTDRGLRSCKVVADPKELERQTAVGTYVTPIDGQWYLLFRIVD